MRILPALLLLAVLSGCQTTQQTNNLDNWKPSKVVTDRDEYRAYLADVARTVCVANLGSLESMEVAAARSGQLIGRQKNVFLGDVQYTTAVYILNEAYVEDGEAVPSLLLYAEGVTCGISTARSIRMPQYMRQNLGIKMDSQVWDMFNYSDIEVTYGYREHPRYPVRQYSVRNEQNEVMDYLEFMTPSAYRQDSMFRAELKSLDENRGELPDFKQDEAILDALKAVCVQNIGDVVSVADAARGYLRTPGVVQDTAALDVTMHLMAILDNSISSIFYDHEGEICGYLEVGEPILEQTVFDAFDAVEMETRSYEEAVMRLGYSMKYDLFVVDGFGVSEADVGTHFLFLLTKETLEKGRGDLISRLPWKI